MFSREFKLEAVKFVRDRGVSVVQASRDLDVVESVLRRWVPDVAADPGQAFPGHDQAKPEQQDGLDLVLIPETGPVGAQVVRAR